MSRKKIKVIITMFLDWKGTFHHEICTTGSDGKKQLYQKIVALLCNAVRRKRPELWLYNENVSAHASLLFRRYLANYQKSVVSHPHYSPDVNPADFFMFPNLETTLKSRRFQIIEDIQENAISLKPAITDSGFQEAFQ